MTPTEIVAAGNTLPVSKAAAPRPRLALSAVEQAAVTRLITGDASSVVALVAERASALANDDNVRRRALARALAVQEMQLSELAAAIADAVARRDDGAVALLDRTATSAARRVTLLAAALRDDLSEGRRTPVLIATNEVNIHG